MEEEGQNSSQDSENHSVPGELDHSSEESTEPKDAVQLDPKIEEWRKLNMDSDMAGFDLADLEERPTLSILSEVLVRLFNNADLSVAKPYIRPFKQVFTRFGLFTKNLTNFDLKASLRELYPDNQAEGGPCRAVVNEDRYVYRCLDCRKNESALMCHACYDPQVHQGHK